MPVTDFKTITTFYQALVRKDPDYNGVFFVGVKTTRIFCIATCRARKPKPENTEFFTSLQEVLAYGYRPCKICQPTENASHMPAGVKRAIALVKENLKQRISDYQLKQENISPVMLRNWFKKHFGLTFHAYQRMQRINQACYELKNGSRTTDTAFDSGYESLSGFGYTYKKLTGKSPAGQLPAIILMDRLDTPIGPMFVAASEEGICLLEFTDRRMLENEFKDLQHRLKARILLGENAHIIQAKRELQEYFAGKRKEFSLTLHAQGSDFQQLVWNSLRQIPYGQTVSYQDQANNLQKPNAVRAVANANGMNKISIVIPCHRVIGKNGHLTGYGGGLARKQWLLDFEKETMEKKKAGISPGD